jgi:hypothetical protein
MPRWLAGFAERHGEPAVSVEAGVVTLTGPDGRWPSATRRPGCRRRRARPTWARRRRAARLLLVRRGGFAVGLADGAALVASKVDRRYVQSRTAAGGWSQQRFARRRDNQAKAAAGEAADECARLLLPDVRRLDAFVTGGDRPLVDAVLADPRLAPLRPLRSPRFLAVPDPKRAVLEAAVASARAVRIRLSATR